MSNLNTVAITGNLTRDPELREAGASHVCSLRVAVNTRRKINDEWTEVPNYFDVTVFGGNAVNCANHLSKGRGIGVVGRLEWSEWETKEGEKRQQVQIIANDVQFLGGKDTPGPVGTGATATDGGGNDIPF